jgi:general stress protein 26
MSNKDPREHLLELLADFSESMLVTHAEGGRLEARPMSVAEVSESGVLWYCAGIDSGKAAQIAANPEVAVVMQGKAKFVSVSGRAWTSRDRAQIDRLWQDSWKLWFPEGKDDPTLCLIAVQPSEGQWWDTSGSRGLRFAFEAAKAFVTGTEAHMPEGESNARVRM